MSSEENLDFVDEDKMTPLLWAVKMKNQEACKALIPNANVFFSIKSNISPINKVVDVGDIDLLEIMIQKDSLERARGAVLMNSV